MEQTRQRRTVDLVENALEEIGLADVVPRRDPVSIALAAFAEAAAEHTADMQRVGMFVASYSAIMADFGRRIEIAVVPKGARRTEEAIAPFAIDVPSYMIANAADAKLVLATLDSVVEHMFRAQWKTL